MIKWLVPNEFRSDLSVYEITKLNYLNLFFPRTFLEFVIYYGAGMIAVLTVFNAILFERSFRLKGIFYGILYCAAVLFIFLIPILVDDLYSARLFLSNGTLYYGSDCSHCLY